MAISTLFFIFLTVAVLGFLAAIVNMACAFKGGDLKTKTFITHFICGAFYVLGSLGAFITGIMWIVTYCKAA